jgi:thioredoxin-related protein
MPLRFVKRLAFYALAMLSAVEVLASAADAAELVMFRRDGCSWCAKWDQEIGPIYPKTEFNRRAPLRQVNLSRDAGPKFAHAPVRYTPTFMLVEDGKEIGRIEGYPGEDFFWVRLENLLTKAPQPAPKEMPPGMPVAGASPVMPEPAR